MKHLETKRKKPVWLLYVLALIALVFAIWALIHVMNGKKNGEQHVPGSGQQQPDNENNGQNGGDQGQQGGADAAQLAEKRAALLAEVELLTKGYYYDEALEKLQNAADLKNDETEAAAQSIQQAKSGLVKYDGMPYHVFFHSLIVYPELAFDNKGHPAEGYNMWMTTVSEFKKMLPLFLENNFILYSINDLYEIGTDGQTKAKDIYLPQGKKPLIISVDDVNYYDYMKPDGFATRLLVNDSGDIVTEVKAPDGTVSETYDGDVAPILDQFVKEHPEFSWRGAKGILATTGYQGAWGYRITDLELYSKEQGQQMLDNVRKVSQRLVETGWLIANHSYTHNGYWRGDITMEELKSDVTRWKELIGTYTGQTNILIVPFGAHYDANDPRYQYMVQQGFNVICPVAAGMTTRYHGNSMSQDRLNLDGYTMLKHPDRIKKYFFDPALVLDPARPPLK